MPITWKNINAPNFSSANNLLAQSGQQINSAFKNLNNYGENLQVKALKTEAIKRAEAQQIIENESRFIADQTNRLNNIGLNQKIDAFEANNQAELKNKRLKNQEQIVLNKYTPKKTEAYLKQITAEINNTNNSIKNRDANQVLNKKKFEQNVINSNRKHKNELSRISISRMNAKTNKANSKKGIDNSAYLNSAWSAYYDSEQTPEDKKKAAALITKLGGKPSDVNKILFPKATKSSTNGKYKSLYDTAKALKLLTGNDSTDSGEIDLDVATLIESGTDPKEAIKKLKAGRDKELIGKDDYNPIDADFSRWINKPLFD